LGEKEAKVGGGPSSEQKQAAASQRALTDQEIAIGNQRNEREQDQYNQIKPYAFDRLNNGLPFFNFLTEQGGATDRAFQPAYASLGRRFAGMDAPSGAREAAIQDLDVQRARAHDDQLTQALLANENAKSEAARLITGQQQIANPAQFYGLANSGNNSIMQAPLQSQGIGGVLGGIAGSAIGGLAGNPNLGKGIPF
jgi:hypothetical protein